MGKLQDVLDKYFACRTRAVENPVFLAAGAAGAAALVVFQNNPDRVALVFVNLSANPIYLGLTNLVTAANGIYVAPNGGAVTLYWQEDFQMVGWAWWCIAPAGASACYSLEVVGE